MILRRDKDGRLQIVWRGKALKDRRMWIRARIPIILRGVEQDVLERLIKAKISPEVFDDFDCMCCEHCRTHADYMRELRLFARRVGVKHWRLKPEPVKYYDGYDDGGDGRIYPADWWK